MKRSHINPGKPCKSCTGNGCSECYRGFVIKKPKPKKRVNPISRKRSASGKEYSAARKTFLLRHPRCQCLTPGGQCKQPATDVHHRRGRSGSDYLDETLWMALCNNCHLVTIHQQHTAWAFKMGYLVKKASNLPVPPISNEFIPYDTDGA